MMWPLLVIVPDEPRKAMPALPTPPLIVPLWLTTERSPCTEMPAALSWTLIVPLLAILASLPNTSMPAPEPPALMAPASLTIARSPCTEMPAESWPTVMVPLARLLTVLSSVNARMPLLNAPAVTVPALLTVLESMTLIAAPPPPSLTVAPGSTLTVRLLMPKPA
jgi:hypothetical protein